jgi:hypothetical protein
MSKPGGSITVMNPSDETIAEWIAQGKDYKEIGPNLYEVTVSESWERKHQEPPATTIKGMIREAWQDYWSPVVALWRWLRRR